MDGGLHAQSFDEMVEDGEADIESKSSTTPDSGVAVPASMPVPGRTPALTIGSDTPSSLENSNSDPSPASLTLTNEDTSTRPAASTLKPYQCQKCLKRFNHSQTAAACRKTSVNNPIECPICKEQYVSAEVLDHHMMADHPMGQTNPECPICNKRFLLEKYLTAHTRACHPKEEDKSSRCSLCGEGFVGPAGLASHLGAGKCGWNEGGLLGYGAAA